MNETSIIPAPASIDAGALLSLAIDKGAGIDVLERLMAIRGELEKENARKDYFADLSQFQSACPVIHKGKAVMNKDGRSVRYHYAPLETIQRAIGPLLLQFGFSYRFQTSSTADSVQVTCIVSHRAGHEEQTQFTSAVDPQAFMNLAQKFGSALTFGKRYALCNGLGIISGDEDDDAQSLEEDKKTPSMGIADDAPWPTLFDGDKWAEYPAPGDPDWRKLGELEEKELLPIIHENVTNGGFNAAVSAACARLISRAAKQRGFKTARLAMTAANYTGPKEMMDFTSSDLWDAYNAITKLPQP